MFLYFEGSGGKGQSVFHFPWFCCCYFTLILFPYWGYKLLVGNARVHFGTLTYTAELIIRSINFVVSACSATFICTPHNHIADFTTIITHNLLPSGLVAQSVEQRTIKYGGLAFDSRRGRGFFCYASFNFPPFSYWG